VLERQDVESREQLWSGKGAGGYEQFEKGAKELGEVVGLFRAGSNQNHRPFRGLPEEGRVKGFGEGREPGEAVAASPSGGEIVQKALEGRVAAEALQQFAYGRVRQGVRFRISVTIAVVE
jgi:hypothetical protein